MSTILTLDISTRTGWACASPTGIVTGRQEYPKHKGMERIFKFADWIHSMVEHYRPELVIIEDYAVSFAGAAITLIEIGTAIRMTLHAHKVPFLVVSPTSLKKFILGKGAGGKDLIMLEVYKRWGFDAPTNDEADAYGLAKLGQAYLGEYTALTKPQAEVLAQIKSKCN